MVPRVIWTRIAMMRTSTRTDLRSWEKRECTLATRMEGMAGIRTRTEVRHAADTLISIAIYTLDISCEVCRAKRE